MHTIIHKQFIFTEAYIDSNNVNIHVEASDFGTSALIIL